MDRKTWGLVALAAFVACVWLNQSVGGKDWEDLRDRVFAAPAQHPVQYARYPFKSRCCQTACSKPPLSLP